MTDTNKLPVSNNEAKVKKITKNFTPAQVKAFQAGVEYGIVALLNEIVNLADVVIHNSKIYTKK